MEKASKINVAVATHMSYAMPDRHTCYVPIQVGSFNKESIGYQRDDEGENISSLNPYYCELTALYWLWKNSQADYLGLVHYRRYFTSKVTKYNISLNINDVVLSETEIMNLLNEADVIVPKKRNYYIENIYNHYAHTFDGMHLDVTREAIKKLFPEYIDDFDAVMSDTKMYICNMFVMSKQHVNAYCEWVFPILDYIFTAIDYSGMTAFEARFVGRISERLFTIWLRHKNLKITEVPMLYFGKVDWRNKIVSFLSAKFTGKKYHKSF